jgi:hypothetical protein
VGLEQRERRASGAGSGCAGFWAWALAGGLMSFSLLTGLTIGLFLLPLAAAVLLVAASRAPYLAESIGFLAGIGGTLLVVGVLQSAQPEGLSPTPWLLAGSACAGFAVAGYATVRRCA